MTKPAQIAHCTPHLSNVLHFLAKEHCTTAQLLLANYSQAPTMHVAKLRTLYLLHSVFSMSILEIAKLFRLAESEVEYQIECHGQDMFNVVHVFQRTKEVAIKVRAKFGIPA